MDSHTAETTNDQISACVNRSVLILQTEPIGRIDRLIKRNWSREYGGETQDLQGESQTGDSGEPMDSFQSVSEGLRTGRTKVVVPTLRPTGLRPRKSLCFSSSLKVGKEPISQFMGRKNFLTWDRVSLFAVFRPSTDWTRPSHIRESNLLDSVYPFTC